MEIINVEEAPEALGPYCSAIRTGNLFYCSGKTGMNFETNRSRDNRCGTSNARSHGKLEIGSSRSGFDGS